MRCEELFKGQSGRRMDARIRKNKFGNENEITIHPVRHYRPADSLLRSPHSVTSVQVTSLLESSSRSVVEFRFSPPMMSASEYSTSSSDNKGDSIARTTPEDATGPFSKGIEEMVQMVTHWMKKKEDLVEELIHLNDSVFATKLADPNGEVEKIVEKYLPKKESEIDMSSEQQTSSYTESEGSSCSSSWLLAV
ncbi:hypothetical protein QR680_007979 [Steinernema hermaphroditum]|uniref:Uncharacterized protein n=1 Tax=Steinernema hermaphroditum TaxID=289476 RepID=A0AA39IHA3_9BILA|nr:hypothetical protein QR680_007979 [Steinernema hermaphroditum]